MKSMGNGDGEDESRATTLGSSLESRSFTERNISPHALKKYETWDVDMDLKRRESRRSSKSNATSRIEDLIDSDDEAKSGVKMAYMNDSKSDHSTSPSVDEDGDLPPGVFLPMGGKDTHAHSEKSEGDLDLEEIPEINRSSVEMESDATNKDGVSTSLSPSSSKDLQRQKSLREILAEKWRKTEGILNLKGSNYSMAASSVSPQSKSPVLATGTRRRLSVGAIEEEKMVTPLRRMHSSEGPRPENYPVASVKQFLPPQKSASRRMSASGRRYSFNNGVRRLSQNLKQMFSSKKFSSNLEAHPGKVFWLHHGECNNDEKNTLTGVIDTSLTDFGQHQATNAGRDVARTINATGETISAVYSSYMLRALETVKYVISEDGVVTPNTQFYVRGDLAGRSFGVFTNANQNLLRSALGYDIFENLLHSSDASPLGGEGIASIYRRCERFYKKQVLPHIIIGENVLVVTHSCNLNVMAHVLAKRGIANYKAFDIPHGKVIESKDLIELMGTETEGLVGVIVVLQKYLKFMVAELSAAAFVVGIALRILIDYEMTDGVYFSCLIGFLATSSFYALLNVNIRTAFKKVPRAVWLFVGVAFLIRWILSMVFLVSVASAFDDTGADEVSERRNVLFSRWALWWIMPPALNTTSLSMWLGGDLYPSAAISTMMSIIIPPLVVLLCYVLPGADHVEVDKLNFFYLILVGGFIFPSAASQFLRSYSPVGSKKHGNRWQLLGGLAHIATVCITGFKLTPADISSHVLCICSIGCDAHDVSGVVLISLVTSLCIAVAIRFFGYIMHLIVVRMSSRVMVDRYQLMDIYLLLTNPNFFMWIAILITTTGDIAVLFDQYTLFFGGFFYFLSFPIEKRLVVKRFVESLIQQSVSNMRMPKSEIDSLWESIKHPDRDYLTIDDLSYAIWIICKQTQGWTPGTAKLTMLAKKLMNVMTRSTVTNDRTMNQKVSYKEFTNYFAWHGKKLDFNTTTDSENDQNYAFDIGSQSNDQQTFLKKWYTRRRKSSLTNHFRKKRMSMTGDAKIAPEDLRTAM